jgi:ribosomal protein S18 acetylase RimI-like enzyme
MNVTITEVEQGDKEALRKIYLRVRQTSFVWMTGSSFNLSSFDADTSGEYIMVARVDGKIAGFVSVWTEDNFIHHLYVDNEYQNKGIGTRLMNEVIRTLQHPVTLKCIKRNTPAIRFYLRHGWEPKSEATSEDGAYILFEYNKG